MRLKLVLAIVVFVALVVGVQFDRSMATLDTGFAGESCYSRYASYLTDTASRLEPCRQAGVPMNICGSVFLVASSRGVSGYASCMTIGRLR